MPEGDTIYRAAVQLRAAIEGGVIESVSCTDRLVDSRLLGGQRVNDIEARGKHLLFHFANRHVLHSHMGMTGSWHLYLPGQRWQKPARRAAISLEFRERVAVCFSPKTLELLSPDRFRRHRYLQQLGPDLLGTSLDTAEVLRRFRIHDAAPVGQAIMNQTIVSGIGNVYKSEVLFVSRINPLRRVAEFDDTTLLGLIAAAQALMQRNLAGYPRRTRFSSDSQRQWVYGRSGKPCFECGTAIIMQRQGDLGRSTYWCPQCQE